MKKTLLSFLIFALTFQLAHSQRLTNEDGNMLPQNLDVDFNSQAAGFSFQTEAQIGDLTTIPAGDDIEGDYIGEMKFTINGDEVWVLNRSTNNVTVIDWETKQIIQNIPVGGMPMDIDFSHEYAVIPCYASNEVWFIRLSDYYPAAVRPVSEQPAKVHVSKSKNLAAIGCDGPDVAEIFNLNNFANILTINDFPVYLYRFSFITSNPRNSVYYSNFRITDDEFFLVNGSDEAGLKFWDLTTGEVVATIPEAGNSGQIELSGDGEKIIAVQTGNPGIVTQVDVSTQSFAKQMELTDVSIFSSYSPPAVNVDGSKVLVPANPGNTALLDFEAETWQHVSTGNTPDWVGNSPDGSNFVAGDYYIAVIDPATGDIESSLNGISIQNGAVGAGNRIVASDPLRDESVLFYEFENPNDLNLTGNSPTGSELEADATYSVKFTPDGKKVLAVNSLSGTLSVIDVEAESMEAIIPLGSSETFHVDVTSDSRYALIAKRLENQVAIVDLLSNELIAEVPSGGSKPDQVFVLPGDEYAYAINAGSGDNIGVIALDGENSSLETTFAIGNTGISWTNYGIRSDFKIASEGTHALLANPFDEQVQVIDLENHEVVETIPVEGFPLQIAIAPDPEFGNFAGVTLKNSSEMALLAGEEDNWSLVETYSCAANPVRIDYDSDQHNFWLVSSDDGKTQVFDLELLMFNGGGTFGTITPIALRYANGSRRFTLSRSSEPENVPHRISVSDPGIGLETYDLPALPIHHFDITPDGTLAAVPHPASDEVSLLKETPLGFEQVVISLKAQPYHLFPNPVADALHFRLKKGAPSMANLDFRLFDLSEKLLLEKHLTAGEAFTISRQDNWPSGKYFYEMTSEGRRVQSGKVIFK